MVAGRYPVFPEAAIFSTSVLDKWGQSKVDPIPIGQSGLSITDTRSLNVLTVRSAPQYHFGRTSYVAGFAPSSSADSQRNTLNKLAATSPTFQDGIGLIGSTISSWKSSWTNPIRRMSPSHSLPPSELMYQVLTNTTLSPAFLLSSSPCLCPRRATFMHPIVITTKPESSVRRWLSKSAVLLSIITRLGTAC